MNVGTLLLAASLLASLVAAGATLWWASGHPRSQAAALSAIVTLALALAAASALHLSNLLTHQFQYAYVADFSDRALPAPLLIAAFWAGQAGSFLLWSLLSALFVLVLAYGLRRSSWRPFVLAPVLLVTAAVVGMTWASNPFLLREPAPADGAGLNPLLQNPWMVLGGVWAYESLGWGGFWGWDPVENSSLVPWLAVTGLAHGLVLQGARGTVKRSNLALAIAGELTVLYSTFLTRSGVLGPFSVHSFAGLGLASSLVVFLVSIALLGFGLLAWRWRQIGRRVAYTRVLSREFGLLVSMVLLVTVLAAVLLGTSMPLISLLPGFPSQVSLDTGWYASATAPLGVLVLLAVGITPWLRWGHSRPAALLVALRWPLILTGVAVLAALLLNVVHPPALLLVSGAAFATFANAAFALRVRRSGVLKLGGAICHIGVGLLLLGVVGNAFYKQTATLQLTRDVPQQVFGRQVVFHDLRAPAGAEAWRSVVQVEVTEPRSGATWTAEAPYYADPASGKLIIHPAIQRGLWGDLYLQPAQYVPPSQVAPGAIIIGEGETRALLGYALTFTHLDVPDTDAMMRGEAALQLAATLRIQSPAGETRTVTPTLRFDGGAQPLTPPAALGAGATVTLREVDVASKLALVQLGGVDLARVTPDELRPRLFAQISTEPGIALVWAGMVLGIVGGLMALVRRRGEARRAVAEAPAPEHLPTPRRGRTTRLAHAAQRRGLL